MKRKKSAADIIFYTIVITLMTFMTFMCLYPFYYVFIYSISDPVEAQKGLTLLPANITFNNYLEVFQLDEILQAFIVSILRTVIGTTLTVLCCSFFAYLVSKENMFCRKLVYRMVIVTMYVSSGLIPYFLTMRAYNMTNTFWIYVIPSAISAYNIILLKTFIENLPPALEESAKLDGAGYIRTFVSIIFPLSKPIVATITVFAAVGQWNSWFDNYIYNSSEHLLTLQLMLYNLLNEASLIADMTAEELASGVVIKMTPEAVRMTVTMVVTLPVLFVYPFMQRHFVKGIMLGAVKG